MIDVTSLNTKTLYLIVRDYCLRAWNLNLEENNYGPEFVAQAKVCDTGEPYRTVIRSTKKGALLGLYESLLKDEVKGEEEDHRAALGF